MSVIQLTSPGKPLHRKWEVTRSWDRSRETRRGAAGPGDAAELFLHVAKWGWAACVRGVMGKEREKERIWRSETFRKHFPPCWEGKLEAKIWFLLGYSFIECFAYASPQVHLTEHHLAGGRGMPMGSTRTSMPKRAAGVGSFCRWKQGLG